MLNHLQFMTASELVEYQSFAMRKYYYCHVYDNGDGATYIEVEEASRRWHMNDLEKRINRRMIFSIHDLVTWVHAVLFVAAESTYQSVERCRNEWNKLILHDDNLRNLGVSLLEV